MTNSVPVDRNCWPIVGVLLLCALVPATSQAVDFEKCPSIADGFPPWCSCRYGPDYDNKTNTCPEPVCPTNATAAPAYPKCDCSSGGRNFEYSDTLNECYRSCPIDASGSWPNCKCDSPSALFSHEQFKCVRCPDDSDPNAKYPDCDCGRVGAYDSYQNECTRCGHGSSGVYPSCSCDDTNATFSESDNKCLYCPAGSSGKVPKCECDNGADFNARGNWCYECPQGSVGIYPNCTCADGGAFLDGYCKTCPWNAHGKYGECVCDAEEASFDRQNERCVACPFESNGTYPDCECEEPFRYDGVNNECSVCPASSSQGIYPDCRCFNGYFSHSLGICVQCPDSAKGIYPSCECNQANLTFSAFINECYDGCPSNAGGKHPYCRCDSTSEYYDPEQRLCRSLTGRRCPDESVGVGPYCLCIRDKYQFSLSSWNCMSTEYPVYARPSIDTCPDSNEKWPQCSYSIDRNTLLSLVG